jgi:hypothetical protein
MYLVRPVLLDGERTIATERIVTHQQGGWKWQVRLCIATYVAHYSPGVKAWLWKSIGQGPSFSGGNIRGSHSNGQGSLHNHHLSAQDLCALQVVLEG